MGDKTSFVMIKSNLFNSVIKLIHDVSGTHVKEDKTFV